MRYEPDYWPTSAFGPLRFVAFHRDGKPMMSSAFVRDPSAIGYVLRVRRSANDEHFFGPTAAA